MVDGGGKWGTVAHHGGIGSDRHPDDEEPPWAAGEVASVFMGAHHPKLDDKGRLFLPAKFREPLQGGLVVTKGHRGCLKGLTFIFHLLLKSC